MLCGRVAHPRREVRAVAVEGVREAANSTGPLGQTNKLILRDAGQQIRGRQCKASDTHQLSQGVARPPLGVLVGGIVGDGDLEVLFERGAELFPALLVRKYGRSGGGRHRGQGYTGGRERERGREGERGRARESERGGSVPCGRPPWSLRRQGRARSSSCRAAEAKRARQAPGPLCSRSLEVPRGDCRHHPGSSAGSRRGCTGRKTGARSTAPGSQ